MRSTHSVFKNSLKYITMVLAVFFTTGITNAYAALINFDDLVYVPTPDDDCFCDHDLTNQYESQGLLIDGGFLSTSDDGSNNFLWGGPFLSLKFVGTLPTKITMSVSAALEDVVFLYAFGPGFNSFKQTLGWAGPFDDTPYSPNQIITFTSASGISGINISAFYDIRVDAMIDDIDSYYSATVPESGSLGLLSLGLLGGLVMRPRRNRHRKNILQLIEVDQ